MSDPFVAEIRIFGFTFAPRGWAFCNGQLMPLSQNTALFSLLGTMYGGDGKSTFALPDLQGSIPIGTDNIDTGNRWPEGMVGGSNYVTLLQSEMPVHTHGLVASTVPLGGTAVPQNNTFNRSPGGNPYSNETTPPLVPMAVEALAPAGGGQPHNNLMPYLTLNYCIALQGIYPARG